MALGWTHSFTRRTSVSPGIEIIQYRDRDTKGANYNSTGLTLGFKHALNGLLEAKGNVGWQYRDFITTNNERHTFKSLLGLTSTFSRRTTITADYKFGTHPAYRSSQTYDEYKFGGGIKHMITRLFTAKASGVYGVKAYEDEEEKETLDSVIGLECNLGKQLYADFSYRFKKLNATDATAESVNNIYMLTVKTKMW